MYRGLSIIAIVPVFNEGAKIVGIDQSWEPTGFSGDRDHAFAQMLKSRPDDALTISCDIGDPEQVQSAYGEAMIQALGERTYPPTAPRGFGCQSGAKSSAALVVS